MKQRFISKGKNNDKYNVVGLIFILMVNITWLND